MSTLSHNALLAQLNISQWTGRKTDKRANYQVETSFATQQKVGNYSKKLLPGAKELEEIQRIAQSIRAFHAEQSLPWHTDGARMVSNRNYMDYTNAFRQYKGQFDYAVSELLRAYPTLCAEAAQKLGSLYNASDYPTVGQLAKAFACDISFMPVPDIADFRTEILDSEKQAFLDRMREVEVAAMQDCWTRLHAVVSKAASSLSNPDAIFRNSLVDNIREICALLPKLNVNDDPALESMRKEVEKVAYSINVESCRASPVSRSDAAKALDAAMSKMGAFMGGN